MVGEPRHPGLACAYRRGKAAFEDGDARTSNPYRDKRTPANNKVTYARAFRNAWSDGWDDASKLARKRIAAEVAHG